MKARHQLLIIFISAILLLFITAYILLSVITSKNKVLLQEGYRDLKSETDKALSLKHQSFENWAYDNSYWDEVITALNRNDTSWIAINVAEAMPKFGSDYLWVMRLDGSIGYNSLKNDLQAGKSSFFMSQQVLLDSLKNSPFKQFHVLFNNELVAIYCAPLQSGSDINRTSKPSGYFIAGQRLNNNFLSHLSLLTGKNNYSFISPTSVKENYIIEKNSVANYYIDFFDLNKKPLPTLKVSKKLDVLNTYKKDLITYLLTFITIILFIGLSVFFYFRKKILQPLNILSATLESKNQELLQKLKPKQDEFGKLANLICDFFTQHKLLKEEIEIRHKSELELLKTSKELEDATIEKIRAEQSHIAKNDFLSTMSHEIRTPINGVIGISNLLMEEELTVRQKEYVNILNFSSRHLLSIVSDILDFSKIESGNIHFDKNSFDLKSTCFNITELYNSRAKEKNINLFFEPDESVSNSLHGDSVRLCQVLTNLVSNAIKFTEKGSVTLKYRNISETTSNITIKFSIKDTGIGIAKDKIDKIFESFSQADASISSQFGGTGLGLTISKKLIELQGGKISVNSELGKGSEFVFYLSFEKHVYVDNLPTPNRVTDRVKNLQGMKVMVVEDNRINAQVLSSFLKKWNIQIELATNGKEALEKLDESEFDLVLMDLQMPVMDGKEATKIIRTEKLSSYGKIPIIALTADASSDTQKSITQFGFNHYLSKPFSPDALYRLLNKYYNVHENTTN